MCTYLSLRFFDKRKFYTPSFEAMKSMSIFIFLLCFIINDIVRSHENANENYSFKVDYENDQFLLDGKPFRYVSGSFHYFRTPKQYWRPIFKKMRAAGLNAVSTYVEWKLHEPELDQWNWDGDADIIEFIKTAAEENLLVLLRPGPYICAERDLGGFPYWLLKLVPDIKLRSRDKRYLFYAEKYLDEILTKIKPYLRGNGGPIIMVQIENEYGHFITCDDEYKSTLYNIFHRHIGENALLYTTDRVHEKSLMCGSIPGVYTTVDFGSAGNVEENYKLYRKFVPKGPLVNSEFYTGTFSAWDRKFKRISIAQVAKTFDILLAKNVSVNFYMFFGGTNFGFSSGANVRDGYIPQLTSYDYDAPLNEAGDPTPKYFELRKIISKYYSLPDLDVPTTAPKGNYGTVHMESTLSLFSTEGRRNYGTSQQEFPEPPTFEALGLPHWLVLYETHLSSDQNLTTSSLHAKTKDRALVYVNDALSGTLSRIGEYNTIPLTIEKDARLQLLVENMGRITSGHYDVEDFKGISEVTLNNVPITTWKTTGFRLASVTAESFTTKDTTTVTGKLNSGPRFFVGSFEIKDEPLDTFLNTDGWGKGVIYINGHNLGRYWASVGPQITLYVPAPFLNKGQNSVVLLELEYANDKCTIEFQGVPILDRFIRH
ncbi:PREDICTED: beta-galactosidase-like [Ceratosolen solmsi marchali]|uniref:Beta-galactosidase n=1 Tax=Ceratosolen solmsi marchali TaxID=326594 RepID=A0AAJ6YBM8_9HYME|nr:PREDICTED: beta-galactosidase-like [Ceratosolen solmsi marchali]